MTVSQKTCSNEENVYELHNRKMGLAVVNQIGIRKGFCKAFQQLFSLNLKRAALSQGNNWLLPLARATQEQLSLRAVLPVHEYAALA